MIIVLCLDVASYSSALQATNVTVGGGAASLHFCLKNAYPIAAADPISITQIMVTKRSLMWFKDGTRVPVIQ